MSVRLKKRKVGGSIPLATMVYLDRHCGGTAAADLPWVWVIGPGAAMVVTRPVTDAVRPGRPSRR